MATNGMRALTAGLTNICIAGDERAMGELAQQRVRSEVLAADRAGKRIVFWLMAAPSGFSWYDRFVNACTHDSEFGRVVEHAEFFQFDDYPIARGDSRFPVTFRHLLEGRVFDRLEAGAVDAERIHLLELTGSDDEAVMASYADELRRRLDDPDTFVLEVKGIGMDGHWGFHGRETPIDAPPDFITIPINRQNRIQQVLDWPQYFPTVDAVPDSAVTATVGLFMRADCIVDLVPQHAKAFAVLAAYGTGRVVPAIPSSCVVDHPSSFSFITDAAAAALAEYRDTGSIGAHTAGDLDALWGADAQSRAWARSVLTQSGIV